MILFEIALFVILVSLYYTSLHYMVLLSWGQFWVPVLSQVHCLWVLLALSYLLDLSAILYMALRRTLCNLFSFL